jgi:two-component system sensor histidine kinase HydH
MMPALRGPETDGAAAVALPDTLRSSLLPAEEIPSAPSLSFEGFRCQECNLILLNLGVLVALFLLHVLFMSLLGPPSKIVLILLGARFAEQTLEFLWLQGRAQPLPAGAATAYMHVSVWVNVAFAFLVSVLSVAEDSHYWVLMVVPVLAAGFRFSLLYTLTVAMVGGALMLMEVWLYFVEHPPVHVSEFFEAATMSVLLLVIGGVVWTLAQSLRTEHGRLSESLTALRTAQAELVAKEKLAAIGRLSSAIAHEIRNPVGMIVSSLALTKRGSPSAEQREEVLGIVQAEAKRLERLTEDFLAYARTRPPEKKPSSVRMTLDYVADIARARARECDVAIVTEGGDDVNATFDPFQIQQALLNLALNAVEATAPGGRVALGAGLADGRALEFHVENSAEEPIPENVQSQLFEPFFTTKPAGTGLGLSIARNLARAHGGDLALTRNGAGGVRFTLTLPEAALTPGGEEATPCPGS